MKNLIHQNKSHINNVNNILNTPLRIYSEALYYNPDIQIDIFDNLTKISHILWKYYSDLDAYIDTNIQSLKKLTPEKVLLDFPITLNLIEAELHKNISKIPLEIQEYILNEHIAFKKQFISRGLREICTPNILDEYTVSSLPLLSVFYGAKGSLLSMPSIIALKQTNIPNYAKNFCIRFIRTYTYTRALIDDIKDWHIDLQRGQVTSVHAECIKKMRGEHWNTHENIVYDITLPHQEKILRSYINTVVIPKLGNDIIELMNQYHYELYTDYNLRNDIARITNILNPMLSSIDLFKTSLRAHHPGIPVFKIENIVSV